MVYQYLRVHIYYAYSILSKFHEKLETLVKIKLDCSYSSSYNCFGFTSTQGEKTVLIHTTMSTCLHTLLHISWHFFYR